MEILFSHAAHGAFEDVGQVGKGGAGGDPLLLAAFFFVVFPGTDLANVFHGFLPFGAGCPEGVLPEGSGNIHGRGFIHYSTKGFAALRLFLI